MTISKAIIKAIILDYDEEIARIDKIDGSHHIFEEEEGVETLVQKLRVLVDGVNPTHDDRMAVPSIDLTISAIFKCLHSLEDRIKALEEKSP